MSSCLVDLMCERLLNREEIQALMAWWKNQSEFSEGLPDFLLRHGCISEAAPVILDLVADGLIQADVNVLNRLFSSEHRNRLRALLQRALACNDSILPPGQFQIKELNYPTIVKNQDFAAKTTKYNATNSKNYDTVKLGQVITSNNAEFAVDSIDFLRPGTILGKYLLLERIGQGAVGLVFRAHHQNLDVPVAIKILKLCATNSKNDVQDELRREARLLAQINHPNVVRVWDYEDSHTPPFLVLEYVAGLSLDELVKQTGLLQTPHAIKIMLQVCQGLKAALQVGIIHRDIKPANILIARDSSVKVADLGLGIVQNSDRYNLETANNVAIGPAGTIAFMSPEQAKSEPVDHRSDIYSLGVTFYYILTGKLPFTGSVAQVLMKHVKETPEPPHQIVNGLDERVSMMILKMMAKAPCDRYQTYDECISELSNCLYGIENNDAQKKLNNDRKTKNSIWETIKSKFIS